MISCSVRRLQFVALLFALGALCAWASTAMADVPGVPLLDRAQSALNATATSSGGGGNGGNASSASSATNTFSPPSFVNYNSLGGEPTTVVDRYPITSGTYHNQMCTPSNPCYPDIVYVSNPLGVGFPGFSQFYKSSDGGTSFRIPAHDPFAPEEPLGTEASGGGDSHQAVGEVTHSVFFVDLSGACVTMNISRDFGETFTSNKLGCSSNPGAIDDRQWVATDETAPDGQDVYLNFNNDSGCLATNEPGCTIAFVKSTDDGGANTPADFAASSCNAFSGIAETGASDTTPTSCPDPADPNFYIAGPIVVDKSPSSPYHHALYIPFERQVSQSDGTTDVELYIAKSTDEGDSWTRMLVANLGPHDAANIFPEMTVDQAGNLYYTWSQSQRFNSGAPQTEGETDIYYAYSQDAGTTWSAPIDLTKETGDSAVFPWMVAGSPGQVDLVYYKANTGLNPNIAYYHPDGSDCGTSASPGCYPNTTQWNTYFAQSQNALNPGANFKSVQISPHPIHQGGVCTSGIACQSTAQQNRDLLDFFTVDVDHTGAAYVTWADDNNSRHDTRQFFSRQLSGASIFAGQNIAAQNSWPTTGHSATDPAGDVYDASGQPDGSCPGMDILGSSATRSGDALTVTLTLNAPPTAAAAIACAKLPGTATGGLWGAEFWAAAPVGPIAANPSAPSNEFGNGEFYIAYRDNPADGGPGVEAGQLDSLSPAFTHDEFHKYEDGAPVGGTCLAATPPTGPCTLVMTASLAGLGIKSGSVLDSMTGLSVYMAGSSSQQPPALRLALGNSNLADAAAPFDVNGTGTTSSSAG
jgi:hypothetical protein